MITGQAGLGRTDATFDRIDSDRHIVGSAAILRAFRHRPDSTHDVLMSAHHLAGLHDRRRSLSSARREIGVSDHHVVACLHKIDEIDAARTELVLEIDRHVSRTASGRPLLLHTETVGAVIDRLAQLWVALNSVVASPDSEAAHRSSCAVAELAHAYDDLIGEISSGRRGVPQW